MITEQQVLDKLKNYNRPILTRHLSPRLDTDRPSLMRVLNSLQNKGLIQWVKPKQDPRDLDKVLSCGWVKI